MKRVISLIGLIVMLAFPFSVNADERDSADTTTSQAEEFDSRSYVLMEASSGSILKEKNKDISVPPASITKIMTLLLVYDAVNDGKIKWEDSVTVSEHAASMGGSQVFMEVGEQQTVKDMVKCISISSANDASVAMAEHIAGSETGFVDMMNKKAAELGMKNTVFKNACGLNIEGHVSSAYDVALMSRELITKYPDITKTSTTWMDTIIHKTRRGESEFGLTNTNKMLKWYNGITGLKTGYTPEAKFCVSATAKRDDLELIAVVLGGSDGKARFREAGELLDYGFSNFALKKGPQVGEIIAQVPVEKGTKETIDTTVDKMLTFVISKNGKEQTFEYKIEIMEDLIAPISKGQKVGEVICLLGGNEVGRANMVANEDVEKSGILNKLKKLFSKQDKEKSLDIENKDIKENKDKDNKQNQ